jgi:hypothetical protein
VRSGPGAARTILLFHIMRSSPFELPRMVRTFAKVFGAWLLFLFLQEQIKDIIILGHSVGRRASIAKPSLHSGIEFGRSMTGKGSSGERVCCLLVLNSVTSTPQWIRQPKPRDAPSSSGGEEEGGGVRSVPGAARTIQLFHIISARPSEQPCMVRTFLNKGIYGAWLLFFCFCKNK